MRLWWVLLLASCRFTPVPATGDDAGDDAPPTHDGPRLDTDGDLVPDDADNCPLIANPDQHDWDGDLHGDVCDRCPHLASTADPDTDGDGVGDACDPEPGKLNQRLIWLGFYDQAEIAGWRNWMNLGTWRVMNRALDETMAVPSLAILDAPINYGDVYFATQIEVTSALTSSATELGFCGGDIAQGHQYYCCAINGGNGGTVRATSAWEVSPGSGGQLSDPHPWPMPLVTGSAIEVTGTMTATESRCTFRSGAVAVAASTTRGKPTPGAPCFYNQVNTPARFRYAFVVSLVGP